MAVKAIPDGFHSVTPYVLVEDGAARSGKDWGLIRDVG